jgi:hypothetical protein
MLHKLLRMFKRALRRRQSDIVYVMCPTCNDLIDAYGKHHCVVIEALEIVYE